MMKIVDTNKYTISTYDIDFSINLLRQIEAVVEKHKFNPKDLSFTLSHSLKKMIAMLEVEKGRGCMR